MLRFREEVWTRDRNLRVIRVMVFRAIRHLGIETQELNNCQCLILYGPTDCVEILLPYFLDVFEEQVDVLKLQTLITGKKIAKESEPCCRAENHSSKSCFHLFN